MKRIGWAAALFLVLSSVAAFANSVTYTITSANFQIYPNAVGDNVYFSMGALNGVAGTYWAWFGAGVPYAPGSTGGGSTTFYFDESFAGHLGSHGADDIQIDCCSNTLFTGSFTFPLTWKEGKNFTVVMPAYLSGVTGEFFSTGQQFGLNLPPGRLSMTFYFYDGFYYAEDANFSITTPEPGTLILMGTGLFAIFRSRQRRRV